MKERILEIMMKNDLTALKFAAILNVQPSNISHILSGRNKPSFDFIEKILTQFSNISPDWLILGSGDMYRAVVSDIETANQPEIAIEDSDSFSQSLFDEIEGKSISNDAVEKSEFTNVNNTNSQDVPLEKGGEITNVTKTVGDTKSFNDSDLTKLSDLFDKEIDKIVVFYKDRRFRTYYPE